MQIQCTFIGFVTGICILLLNTSDDFQIKKFHTEEYLATPSKDCETVVHSVAFLLQQIVWYDAIWMKSKILFRWYIEVLVTVYRFLSIIMIHEQEHGECYNRKACVDTTVLHVQHLEPGDQALMYFVQDKAQFTFGRVNNTHNPYL